MTNHQLPLTALLHRANQIVDERFTKELGDSDLTVRQLQVLDALEARPGVSQTSIVHATGIDRSTLADIMLRLVRRGLIQRRRTKEDARAYAVKLTDGGRKALLSAKPVLDRVDEALLSALPKAKRAELINMLGLIVADVDSTETHEGGR